jgi:hypothetical protein
VEYSHFEIGNKRKLIDYIFWILLILLTNPGGIQQTLRIDQFGRVNLIDITFPVLTICYFLASSNSVFRSEITKKVQISFLFFAGYYFLVYGYLTPLMNNSNSGFILNFIKIRWAFYSLAIFFFVIRYWRRSWHLFLKLFLFSSLIILSTFLFQIVFGLEILKLNILNRGFINLDRYLMYNYGLMPFLTSLGIAIIVFRFKIKYRNLFLIGLFLINISWVLGLARRHIIGLFLIIVISILLYQVIYISKSSRMIKVIFRTVTFFILIALIAYYAFPTYFKSTGKLFESTINVAAYGKNLSGGKDSRMNLFGRSAMMTEFKNSPFLGTGFNMKWRGSQTEETGYDVSDYPFQAALAMVGIIGLIFFLPVYVFLIKAILKDIGYIRSNKINSSSLSNMILFAFIISNIYGLLQYMNWFSYVSFPENINSLLSLGLYFASREIFYAEREFQSIYFRK